ncbi:MAG TPA: tyrosine-type recombinase/integrase [Steroidobacteraceae bacterium]|nr:tyrosine-type recombinase/integrase [Steroidobacteraceae bacterium]
MTRRRIQLQAYAARFLVRAAGLSPNAQARYRSQLKRHILPQLGRKRLDRIDTAVAQAFLAQLLATKLAPSSVCSVGRLLLRILSVAGDEGFEAVRIDARRLLWPRSQTAPCEARSFSQQEVDRILAASSGWPHAVFASLALAGLRIGEALGLDWAHVDFSRSVLDVRQQASRCRLRRVKSRTSQVVLPMHPRLEVILADYWRTCGQPPSGLVFGRYGLPRSAEGFARCHLGPLLKRLEIPPGGLHAFRHYHCTALWAAGVPAETIRRLMRHSSLSMTQRYSHAGENELRRGIVQLASHVSAAQ